MILSIAIYSYDCDDDDDDDGGGGGGDDDGDDGDDDDDDDDDMGTQILGINGIMGNSNLGKSTTFMGNFPWQTVSLPDCNEDFAKFNIRIWGHKISGTVVNSCNTPGVCADWYMSLQSRNCTAWFYSTAYIYIYI